MRSLCCSFLIALLCSVSSASLEAAIIATQGFEATGETWNYAITGAGGSASTANPAAPETPASSRIRSGLQSFQHNPATSVDTTSTVTFDPLDISLFDSTQVELHLASTSTTTGNGADLTDVFQVFIALNGGAFSATPDITIGGNSNARWSFTSGTGIATTTAGTPLTLAPAGGGGRTTDGYSTLRVNLPDSATTFALKFVSFNNNTGEVWAVDDVLVSGTPSAVPEPGTCGLLALGGLLAFAGYRRRAA
jgi:hypothetical protein